MTSNKLKNTDCLAIEIIKFGILLLLEFFGLFAIYYIKKMQPVSNCVPIFPYDIAMFLLKRIETMTLQKMNVCIGSNNRMNIAVEYSEIIFPVICFKSLLGHF